MEAQQALLVELLRRAGGASVSYSELRDRGIGRALSLSGDNAAAVGVLEQRLQIDNQRPVVLAELALARSDTQPTQSR